MKASLKGFCYAVVLIFLAICLGWGVSIWLLQHVPQGSNLPDIMENEPSPQVDENGRPVLLQPEQPLMSGEQGVPEAVQNIEWHVDGTQIASVNTRSVYSSSYETVDIGETSDDQVPEEEDYPGMRHADQMYKVQYDWESELIQALKQCDNRSFNILQRRQCVRDIKQEYCSKYHAWGQGLCGTQE